MKLNMFRATHCPSSGDQNCTSSFWFFIRERSLVVVVAGRWQRPATTTTFHVCKTRGCQCRFELLMMGGVSPETCWASYKHGIINFDTLLHIFVHLFMNRTMMHRSTNIKFMKESILKLPFFLSNELPNFSAVLLFVLISTLLRKLSHHS
jgi:hypothetical protein